MTSEPASEGEIQLKPDRLNNLCRIGGFAALVLVISSLATMVQIMILGGQPTSAAQAFDLLQHHRAIALLRLDLPTVTCMPLYYFVFLGLFAALRRNDQLNTLLATVLAFTGTTLVLATPTALSLIPLSDKFAATTNDTARNQLLAAGEALLATDIWHSTGAIVGGVLLQCGAVLISIVMLKGSIFTKTTAWIGIIMHGLDLAHILGGLLLPTAGFVLLAIAGPLYPVWFILVGVTLLNQPGSHNQRSRHTNAESSNLR
jgi:hypothetical protein